MPNMVFSSDSDTEESESDESLSPSDIEELNLEREERDADRAKYAAEQLAANAPRPDTPPPEDIIALGRAEEVARAEYIPEQLFEVFGTKYNPEFYGRSEYPRFIFIRDPYPKYKPILVKDSEEELLHRTWRKKEVEALERTRIQDQEAMLNTTNRGR